MVCEMFEGKRICKLLHEGEWRFADCADIETMFRIIQSIPSPKVEPLKRWLAEATTTKLHRDRDSQGFEPLRKDAEEGGAVAGSAHLDIEKRTGRPVVASNNFKVLTGKFQEKNGT